MVRILLDVDEVLADFRLGAKEIHGLDDGGMAAAFGGSYWEGDNFWAPINRNEAFWVTLKPKPWAKEVLDLVRSTTDDWMFVTKPHRCASSYTGKLRWLQRLLEYSNDVWRRFYPVPDKTPLANPSTILIDDMEDNVAGFRKAGGKAVLFPSNYNRLCNVTDVVRYVKHALGLLVDEIEGSTTIWGNLSLEEVCE